MRPVNDANAAISAAPFLSILGVDPAEHETAPASYIGAMSGAALASEECYVSADFVALFRDTVADVEPGPLRHAESEVLRKEACRALGRAGFRLLPGRASHHVAIAPRASVDPSLAAPDFVLGRRLKRVEPRTEQHAFAHRLGREALDSHEINAVRRDLGENGADMVWLSGPGGVPRLASTEQPTAAFGQSILWQAVCRARGIPLRQPLAKSANQILRGLGQSIRREESCFVYSGRGVRDARTGRLANRVDGICDIDKHLIGPVARLVAELGARLLILPDHARDTETGRPLADPVPVLVWGDGVSAVAERPFHELGARGAGDPIDPAHELLPYVRHL